MAGKNKRFAVTVLKITRKWVGTWKEGLCFVRWMAAKSKGKKEFGGLKRTDRLRTIWKRTANQTSEGEEELFWRTSIKTQKTLKVVDKKCESKPKMRRLTIWAIFRVIV